ncbi:MAG: caspase family protein, partial [Bacteroidota bacterium]
DDYKYCSKLSNCKADAEALMSLLVKKYGFAPERMTTLFNADASRENIYAHLEKLVESLEPDDNLLIYFSGHGETDLAIRSDKNYIETGYWIPYEGKIGHHSSFISTTEIKTILNKLDAFHLLMLVDACFSGAIFANESVKGIGGPSNQKSRWGISASHSREIAYDGKAGENSPFAKVLLSVLETNKQNLGSYELGLLVQKEVSRITDDKQNPISEPLNIKGHEFGQFIFRAGIEEHPSSVHRPPSTHGKKPSRWMALAVIATLLICLISFQKYFSSDSGEVKKSCHAPTLLGLSVGEAVKELADKQHIYKLDSLITEQVDAGKVVHQMPTAGTLMDSCQLPIVLKVGYVPVKKAPPQGTTTSSPSPNRPKPQPQISKCTFAGRVIDKQSKGAVKGVVVGGLKKSTLTDQGGFFHLELDRPSDVRSVTLYFEAEGYETTSRTYYGVSDENIVVRLVPVLPK